MMSSRTAMVTRQITRPTVLLTEAALKMSSGDLSVLVQSARRDEFGRVAGYASFGTGQSATAPASSRPQAMIEVDTQLKESPVFGQPVTLYAPHTRGTAQYRALAQELMTHGW